MTYNWKEAATIILIAFKQAQSWNYEVLSLQRSLKSSFMPNGYVFPGGIADAADKDKKWIEIFKEFKLDYNKAARIDGSRAEIIKNIKGEIPKLLSLKITAIRETFEETGILLCIEKNNNLLKNWISVCNFEGLDSWRSKVQKDGSEFLNLCNHFNCCPDIVNLHLWSNWLTPTSMGSKRFDTAFFIASLDKIPMAVADKKEIYKLNWSTPNKLIELNKNNEIWLPPPQVYEIARLLQFKNIVDLNKFAMKRSFQGCERWMPVRIKTLDGSVSILPGDDAYPDIDYFTPTESIKINLTNEEFRLQSNIIHRMEFKNETETKIFVKNYKPKNDHVLPVSENMDWEDS